MNSLKIQMQKRLSRLNEDRERVGFVLPARERADDRKHGEQKNDNDARKGGNAERAADFVTSEEEGKKIGFFSVHRDGIEAAEFLGTEDHRVDQLKKRLGESV